MFYELPREPREPRHAIQTTISPWNQGLIETARIHLYNYLEYIIKEIAQ